MNDPEKKMEEIRRMNDGDGTLRLWRVMVMWLGGDDLLGSEEQQAWVARGALTAQWGYLMACVGLDLIASVTRLVGTQNKQVWQVWAYNRGEAEGTAWMSPLGELGMVHRVEADLPEEPLLVHPKLAKAFAARQRHPAVDRVMAGMTMDELMEWAKATDSSLSFEECVFRMETLWRWHRRVAKEEPSWFPPEYTEELWRSLVRMSEAGIKHDETAEEIDRAEKDLRRTKAFLSEAGVDVEELRRRIAKAQREGLWSPGDPWTDIPMIENAEEDEEE